MKTIGLLGGMSWESTLVYYRLINQGVSARLGGLHSAHILLESVDFGRISSLMQDGRWPEITERLTRSAQGLADAGADFLLICTNTMHKLVPEIQRAIAIPILHIADATAQVLLADGVTTAGLLGTRFTMEETFYRDRLSAHGITVVTPAAADRRIVDRVIFEELCRGEMDPGSRKDYLRIVTNLQHQGARAIVLGCTEIGLLIDSQDASIPLYDTAAIHAAAAVKFALQ